MESKSTFQTYPFQKTQSFHSPTTFQKYPSQKTKSLPKNTHYFTLFSHLLILITTFPFLVSSQSWDGIIVTESDFQALQSFKQHLIDPNGFLKSWNDTGYGACSGSWEGIKCAQGQVIIIQLPFRGLSGQITTKIGQFQALRKLSLHDNQITGLIPKELGFLVNLRGIQLYNNNLTGLIPNTLGLCTLLQNLDFSNNSLVGEIPDSFRNCTKLFNVNLSFNLLSNSIPSSLVESNSVMFLSLQYNNFSGVISDSWGGNGNGGKSLVKSLSFDHNLFTGMIPVSLSKLTELEHVSFSHNKFNGEIPVEFGRLVKLKSLDLSYNSVSSSIPFDLTNLASLALLNVSYNNLSGSVPVKLSTKFDSSSFIGNLGLCGYSPSTMCTLSLAESHHNHHRRINTKEILLIVGGVLIASLLVICCILLCCLLKKEKTVKQKDGEQGGVGPTKGIPAEEAAVAGDGVGKLVHFEGGMEFTADDLLCATAEIMGKSTYGTVYKATLVEGNEVAVKRSRERITKNKKEFQNEVNSIGKIRHQNLLAMRAYYLGPKGEKLLVFDFMPKGSLASFLHARGPNSPIDWPTRMRIAKGMTKGLLNLHTQQNIIHGNLTSNNVLLDDDLNAKIADYGLSRLMMAAANSNVIATAGALGYRAPELSKLKKANTKTDIYSLGVIMLELLTGKSPGEAEDGVDLPQWVASIVKEEWTNEVFDLELMKDASAIGDELLNTLKLALHCVDPSPSARPEAQLILQQLEEIRLETPTSSTEDGSAAGPSATE